MKEEKSKFDIFMVGFFDKVFGFIMSLSEFCHFFPNTESLIFRNLIFHKNKRINELYFQFEARHKNIGKKMAEIMIILNMSQYYTKTFAIKNCSIFFKSGICEKNILCVRKKSTATKINIK